MIGVVCGLASEAAVIRQAFRSVEGLPAHKVAVSGADPRQAEREANRLVDEGADTLISMGLCGALDPHLKTGDVVCAATVLAEASDFDGTQMWDCSVPVGHGMAGCHSGGVLAVDKAITSVADKQAGFARTGAVAVDMESHALMRVAAGRGLPGMVLRVVVDDAATALPPFVGEITSPSGHPKLLTLAGWLLRRPGELSSFVALARASSTAHRALKTAATRLAERLGAPV